MDMPLSHTMTFDGHELSKIGKIIFNHPEGTYDRFWVVVLNVYVEEKTHYPQVRSQEFLKGLNHHASFGF
jgi:hypothetical protein